MRPLPHMRTLMRSMGAVALLMLVAAWVCGGARAEEGEPLTGTLETIDDRGTILIGYRNSALPFSFLNRAGQPVGSRWTCVTGSPRTWRAP
jgi:hypothetical protein